MSITEGMLCPNCAGEKLQKITGYTFEYKGKTLSLPDYIYFYCSKCEEDLESGTDNLGLDEQIINFMRSVDDLLPPAEIKRIRTENRLTQEEFAKLLGVGAKSFSRYEKGYVTQGKTMDLVLKLIDFDNSILNCVRMINHSAISNVVPLYKKQNIKVTQSAKTNSIDYSDEIQYQKCSGE